VTGIKILTLDIETSAHILNSFGLFNQNIGINQIIQPGQVIGVGYKWLDKPKARFVSDFHNGHEEMLTEVHAAVDEADAIVGWNSQRFDLPWLRGQWFSMGLKPPSPHKNIDLMLTVKKQFRLASNKLDWFGTVAGLGNKLQHPGFSLWTGCANGDPKSWALMKRYCLQDVNLTEQAYVKLLPWISNHPHMGLYGDTVEENVCQTCGSANVQKRGFAYTALGRYQQYQCVSAGCGRWSRGSKMLDHVDLRGV